MYKVLLRAIGSVRIIDNVSSHLVIWFWIELRLYFHVGPGNIFRASVWITVNIKIRTRIWVNVQVMIRATAGVRFGVRARVRDSV